VSTVNPLMPSCLMVLWFMFVQTLLWVSEKGNLDGQNEGKDIDVHMVHL
jgi:hypothetical protein